MVASAAAIWGTMGVALSAILDHSQMGSLGVAAMRMLVGGLVLVLVASVTGELRRIEPTLRTVRYVVLTGVLAGIFSGAYFMAVDRIGVAITTVLTLGSAPLFVVLVTALARRRRPSASESVALVLALAGLLLVTRLPSSTNLSLAEFATGATLAIVSGSAFGLGTIVNRRKVSGLTPVTLSATSFVVGGLLTLAVLPLTGERVSLSADLIGWAWFGYLVLVPTVLGYLVFYAGLHAGVPSTAASLLGLVEVITATLLAMALLGEHVSESGLVGMMLILAGALIARPPRQPGSSRRSTQAPAQAGFQPSSESAGREPGPV